ncbi:unnamed protein product, partial [Polarella glacialis]
NNNDNNDNSDDSSNNNNSNNNNNNNNNDNNDNNDNGSCLSCVLVEPEPPAGCGCKQPPEAGMLWLEEPFDARRFPRAHRELLRGCSLVLGFHPDEATEPIVDCALRLRKPFAVVPCCVYPSLSPSELLRLYGKSVSSYEDFVVHLKAKSPRIQSAQLDCDGRNQVLYAL